MVPASSATAAPPANALPNPLASCSINANPAARAPPAHTANATTNTRRTNTVGCRIFPLLWSQSQKSFAASIYRTRFAILIHGHISQGRFGDFDGHLLRRAALSIYLHIDGDRGAPDFDDFRIEAHQIADQHRLLENEGIDRDGCNPAFRHPQRGNAASDVHVRHDPAAEDVAVRIRIRSEER